MKQLLAMLLMFAATDVFSEGQITWKPGTLIQSEYKEMAGMLSLGTPSSPSFRSDGNEYHLVLLVPENEIPSFKNKTAVIMKGIAGTFALPGQPVQYLFWPMECTIKTKRFVFPDPAASHWEWMKSLGPDGAEIVPSSSGLVPSL